MAFTELILGFTLWAESTIGVYGYPGIFIASLLGSASVILPLPTFSLVFAMGSVLNPWLVGIAAGVGAGIGEITGYAVGCGGREAAKSRYKKQLKKAMEWIDRSGTFITIVVFNATPLPADVIGLLAGVMKYDWKKFLFASVIGKMVQSILLALGGYYSLEAVKIIAGM